MNARLATWSACFLGFAVVVGACSAAESEGTVDPGGSNNQPVGTGGQIGMATGGLGSLVSGTGGVGVPANNGGTGVGAASSAGGGTATGGADATGGLPGTPVCPTFEPNAGAYCSTDQIDNECGPYPSGVTCTCVSSGLAGAWECS